MKKMSIRERIERRMAIVTLTIINKVMGTAMTKDDIHRFAVIYATSAAFKRSHPQATDKEIMSVVADAYAEDYKNSHPNVTDEELATVRRMMMA